jgi:hypothetical protein
MQMGPEHQRLLHPLQKMTTAIMVEEGHGNNIVKD